MIIRKAVKEDIPKVAEIYNDIHEAEAKGLTVTGWLKNVYPTVLTAQAAFERGDLFVAELGGEIAAAAIINKNQGDIYKNACWEFVTDDEHVMVLHTLVVKLSCFHKGIGRQMVAFYEQYALKNGCPELRMDTNARNQKARKLYKKLGYKEVSIVPCIFNGIPDVQLVCLEKRIG